MATDRLQALLQFAEQNPDDAFVRYGLAQEYANQGQLEKAAEEFTQLVEINPGYQAAYYHGGQTYLKLAVKTKLRNGFVRELIWRAGRATPTPEMSCLPHSKKVPSFRAVAGLTARKGIR